MCNNVCVGTQQAKVTIETKDLVSIPQAAKELGINPSTIYRWIYKGEVIPFRIGSQAFITRYDLNALKKERGRKT